MGSPEGDGAAELGVQSAKRRTRAIRSALEANHRHKLDDEEPILMFLPRHAVNGESGHVIMEYRRTSEQRRAGKRWRRPTVLFGEK